MERANDRNAESKINASESLKIVTAPLNHSVGDSLIPSSTTLAGVLVTVALTCVHQLAEGSSCSGPCWI